MQASPEIDMMPGSRLSNTVQARPDIPQNGTTAWAELGQLFDRAKPIGEYAAFERSQREGLDRLDAIDQRRKELLQASAQRGMDAPERQRVGRKEALTAAAIAALGRAFGARSAPVALQQFLQGRQAGMDENFQTALQKWSMGQDQQRRQDEAALAGMDLDAASVGRLMGFEGEQYNARAAQRQAQQKFEADREDAMWKRRKEAEELEIKREGLIPDTIRTFQSFYSSLIDQGVDPEQARIQAYNTAFYQAHTALQKEAREGRMEEWQVQEARAKIADILKTTELRPHIAETNRMNAETGRLNAENMNRYRQGSLDIQQQNADTARYRADIDREQGATKAAASNPIIKEKEAVLKQIDGRIASLIKLASGSDERYGNLLDPVSGKWTEQAKGILKPEADELKRELNRLRTERQKVLARIAELKSPSTSLGGMVPPFNPMQDGVMIGKIGK